MGEVAQQRVERHQIAVGPEPGNDAEADRADHRGVRPVVALGQHKRAAHRLAEIVIRSHASRGGHTLNYRVAEIYHVVDGLITQRWAFSDDTEAIARFFG